MITFLVFLLILSILVLIHEAGHFFVAKKFGIKVEEFGFGIPPRAWGKKIGETIYSINWLPIGGFVKLFGEDDAGAGRVAKGKEQRAKGEDLSRAFFARPVWQRVLVVVAGVIMNAVLAFVIYYAYLGISGWKTEIPLYTKYRFFGVNQTDRLESLVLTEVLPDSPAAKAGLKPCTEKYCLRLLSIGDEKIDSIEEFRAELKNAEGKQTAFVFENIADKKKVVLQITPRLNPPKDKGALGVRFNTSEVAVLEYKTATQKLFSGIVHPINVMAYQFEILARLVRVSLEQGNVEPVGSAFSGPVGIFVVTGEVLKIPDVKEKVLAVLNLAGLLSASLAIFNVLPIPALDGGRLFFILAEGITGRKVNQRTEALIHSIGMAVLLGLILLITFKDIFQFFIK
ncbi:MAG: site-2 protease family protein [Candidatus Levybacteria bacterium]|nr:site-2 protease family protein [Candidatus Levybacteria bacterium]